MIEEDCRLFTKFEIEVLNTLWRENRSLTKQEIIQLTADKTWKPATADYILRALVEKEAIAVEGFVRSGTKHYSRTYKATITLEEYAARHLSEVVPAVNFSGVFSQLVGKGKISADDVRELRQLIDELGTSKDPER